MCTEANTRDFLGAFALDVARGLGRPGQKELPCKYLYDEIGSELFEVITLLPEYGNARAGARLLRRHGPDIVERSPSPFVVAELGSGSGRKTRWILEAAAALRPVSYHPIDISRRALERVEQELGTIDGVSIVGFENEYLDGLRAVAARLGSGESPLVLFLGGSIGNFDRPAGEEFLRSIREIVGPRGSLLLATDLVKPVDQILLAYDDPRGVTAAFNLNLLGRINRELDADFELSRFEHRVRWEPEERRIEMHLRSRVAQGVTIRRADLHVSLEAGETIWTESAYKFEPGEIPEIARRTGFRLDAQWVDPEWPYAQNLLIAE